MSKRPQITSTEILRKLSKNKITNTNHLLNHFPSMKMPALTAHLMKLTRQGLVEKLGSNLYRASNNRDYYRVTRYTVLPVDLFKLAKKCILQNHTLRETEEIVGISFESVKFVNNVLKGRIVPEIELKTSVQVQREEVYNLFNSPELEEKDAEPIEPVEEVTEEVSNQDLVEVRYKKEPFHINHVPVLNYFTISVNGVNLKVEEGLHLMYENETVFISR